MIGVLEPLIVSDVKRQVLRYIFQNRQATRSELVQASGHVLMSVTTAVSSLIEDGLLVSDGTVAGGMGRRKNIIKLNPSHKYVLGLDIGFSTTKMGVIMFNGDVAESKVLLNEKPLTQGMPLEATIEILHGFIRKYGADKFLGIGASISGMVDVNEGKVLFCPNISGFYNRAFSEELYGIFGLPVFIDTSARCMAIAEMCFGVSRGIREQMFISMGYGSIASGLIINGSIYQGVDGFAGELGHVRIENPVGNSGRCTCGNMDCLELYASLTMAIRRIVDELRVYNGYSITKSLMEGGALSPEHMVEAYRKGDTIVRENIERVAGYIGSKAADAVNFTNPGMIILSGGFIWHLPEMVELIEGAIKSRCLVPIRNKLLVKRSSLNEHAPLQGSAIQLISRYLRVSFS